MKAKMEKDYSKKMEDGSWEIGLRSSPDRGEWLGKA